MRFAEWLEKRRIDEMMGSVASIVSCGDYDNPNFQVQGAVPERCRKKKKNKILYMKFNGEK